MYVLNKKENLEAIFRKFRGIAWINCQYFFPNRPVNKGHQNLDINHFRKRELPEGYRRCPEAYLQKLELRKYAYNTARTYISLFEAYMNYYADRELTELNEEDVRKYLQHLIQQKKSASFLNQAVNAIKFYYEVVQGMPNRFYSIERPRKEEKLPEVLSKKEIKHMIRVTNNLKHQCIISLLYSAGLRRGELLNLKILDIDSQRMLIKVVQGKGKKDRFTLLGKNVLHLLRTYYREYRPKEYLFEGEQGGRYSATSLLKIVKEAAQRAGIHKRVYPHILRHSFATATADRAFVRRRDRSSIYSSFNGSQV